MHSEDAILRELLRREEKRAKIPDFYSLLFDKQQNFVNHKSTFKAACCTRRAGKSFMAGCILYQNAFKFPNSTALYVGLTRESCRNIMWPIIEQIKETYKLPVELVDSKMQVHFPNGSKIWLVGADMKNFLPRLLGGKYPVGIIDEAQSFRQHIKELVDDILEPAVLDYNGSIFMFGTPGPVSSGYFYEAVEKKNLGYDVFHWSLRDNPHLPNAEAFLQAILKRRNWTPDHPTFRRQYLGQWVEDLDALVYKYAKGRNDYLELPTASEWNRILSLDFGWHDKTAFGITAYNYKMPNVWLEHAEAHSEMIPSEIAGRAIQLIEKFKPSKIVADTGGLGKSIAEEMRRRYSIPVVAASKTDKQSWISLMNGDLRDGNYKIHESLTPVVNQMRTLTKADDGSEDPNLPNDLCDIALYGYREAKAYSFEVDPARPENNEQKWRQEEDHLLRAIEERIVDEENGEWWEKI
jgi:hypothetical protein